MTAARGVVTSSIDMDENEDPFPSFPSLVDNSDDGGDDTDSRHSVTASVTQSNCPTSLLINVDSCCKPQVSLAVLAYITLPSSKY